MAIEHPRPQETSKDNDCQSRDEYGMQARTDHTADGPGPRLMEPTR